VKEAQHSKFLLSPIVEIGNDRAKEPGDTMLPTSFGTKQISTARCCCRRLPMGFLTG